MNAASVSTPPGTRPANERSWSRPVWLFMVVLTCAGQFGLIYLMGARHSSPSRGPSPAPPITLVEDKNASLLELTDPTIFVLPNRHGFSGAARAMTPRNKFVAPDWNEPFRWLPLAADRLGNTFALLLATDLTPPVQIAEKTEPRSTTLITTVPFTLPPQSLVRVEGGLAGRELVAPPDLPAWPSADVLKASEVQVIVDAGGRVVSATLLGSSDLAEADQRALELARAARFEPAGPPGLTWGRLIFAWHTIPQPSADETAVPLPLP